MEKGNTPIHVCVYVYIYDTINDEIKKKINSII